MAAAWTENWRETVYDIGSTVEANRLGLDISSNIYYEYNEYYI